MCTVAFSRFHPPFLCSSSRADDERALCEPVVLTLLPVGYSRTRRTKPLLRQLVDMQEVYRHLPLIGYPEGPAQYRRLGV